MKVNLFIEALASTHAITFVDKKLVGDPLDVKMFEAVKWELHEMHDQSSDTAEHDANVICYVNPIGAKNSKYRSALVRRFDFTSALMRMSVICKNQIDG